MDTRLGVKFSWLLLLNTLGIFFFPGCEIDKYSLQNFSTTQSFQTEPLALVAIRNEVSPPDSLLSEFDVERPPNPLTITDPEYPERLRYGKIEGNVQFYFIVDTNGAAVDPQIIYATDTAFARCVIEALPSWRIEPAQNDGKPVACYRKHITEFRLGGR